MRLDRRASAPTSPRVRPLPGSQGRRTEATPTRQRQVPESQLWALSSHALRPWGKEGLCPQGESWEVHLLCLGGRFWGFASCFETLRVEAGGGTTVTQDSKLNKAQVLQSQQVVQRPMNPGATLRQRPGERQLRVVLRVRGPEAGSLLCSRSLTSR